MSFTKLFLMSAAGAAASVSATAAAVPLVSQTFCASMHDYLVISPPGGPEQRNDMYYDICLDRINLMYTKINSCKTQKACAAFPNRNLTYIHRDEKMYVFTPTDAKDGLNCTYVADPTDKMTLPFDFLTMDNDPTHGYATYVNTTSLHGESVDTWSHVRGGPHGTMYWSVKTARDGKGITDMVLSTCANHAGTTATAGNRDYFKNYRRAIPEGSFDLPQGITCSPAGPPSKAQLVVPALFLDTVSSVFV